MVPLNEDDTPSACPLAEGSTLTAPDSERVRNFLEAKGIQQSDLVYWWQMGWRKAWKDEAIRKGIICSVICPLALCSPLCVVRSALAGVKHIKPYDDTTSTCMILIAHVLHIPCTVV